MSALSPTPDRLLLDDEGRPYFLWDSNTTLHAFETALRTGDEPTRAYLAGKLLRQAKPDDVFRFLSLSEIRALWPLMERHLGKTRAFWRWLLDEWRA